jgi:DNA primase
LNLIDALEAAEIDYHQGRDDDEIFICCPWCSDQRFRLGVNVRSGLSNCFNDGCGWKGYGEYTFNKLQEALDTGEIEAKQSERKRKKKHMQLELPEGFRDLIEFKDPNKAGDYWIRTAWHFIRKRGITRDQIKEKKIGYSVIGPMAYRIVFPVYLSGVLTGLVGRDFTGKQEPKYKNSIGAKCLYNLPEHKHSTVCLSEGVFDALAIEHGAKKLGIDSVALLGHSIKDDQIEMLHHYKRIIVWLDPDDAGIEGLISIRNKLKDRNVKVVLPKGMMDGDYDRRDPSEMETSEIKSRLERAEHFGESLAEKLAAWRAFDE